MISVKTTKNNTGLTVSGDFYDIYELYESIERICGLDNEYDGYERVTLRILGVCYELRHCFMGHREISLVENNYSKELSKFHNVIHGNTNLNYSVNILWIEILFAVVALEDFILIRTNTSIYPKSSNFVEPLKEVLQFDEKMLNTDIAYIHHFRELVMNELSVVLGEESYARIHNLLQKKVFSHKEFRPVKYRSFMTQYIDELEMKYLKTDFEKRPARLASCIRKFVEPKMEYIHLEADLRQYASENNVPVSDLTIGEYPDEIEW